MTQHLHISQAEIIGNHVEITFELYTQTFRLSVFPVPKVTATPICFTQTCNALVQLVLQAKTGTWHFSQGQRQMQDTLQSLPKPELLALCRVPRMSQYCSVQVHLRHGPRPCELQQDQDGEPVLRLTCPTVPDAASLDIEEGHFYRLYIAAAAAAEMAHVPASEISVTAATSIGAARIGGKVYRVTNGAVYHCIAGLDASARGARRWACPARRQLLARLALQTAKDDCSLRVPALLACIYDDDAACPQATRPWRIMGGLYARIEGTPLRAVLAAAAAAPRGPTTTLRVLAARIADMMGSLHERGLVWGGESDGDATTPTLIDCLVVDGQGCPWLVDGFGAAYHDDVVRSDNKAFLSLLDQMKACFPESVPTSGDIDSEAVGWPE